MPMPVLRLSVLTASFSLASSPHPQGTAETYGTERFFENPVITPGMLENEGENINGPSLIKAPDRLQPKLGKYYLYFAHHEGEHIRLAYADDQLKPLDGAGRR